MSRGNYKSEKKKKNDNVGHDDNNTPKVNSTSYQYDEKRTRASNLGSFVSEAPKRYEAKIKEKQRLKQEYKEHKKESGLNSFQFERKHGSLLTGSYKGKPKKGPSR